MASEINIVPASAKDRPILTEYYRQLCAAHGVALDQEEAGRRLDRILSAPYRVCLLQEGSEIIGTAIWMEMGDHVILRHFTIDKSRRRSGLGARAFHALEEASLSGREIELTASSMAAGPSQFWLSLGFRPVGQLMRRDERADQGLSRSCVSSE